MDLFSFQFSFSISILSNLILWIWKDIIRVFFSFPQIYILYNGKKPSISVFTLFGRFFFLQIRELHCQARWYICPTFPYWRKRFFFRSDVGVWVYSRAYKMVLWISDELRYIYNRMYLDILFIPYTSIVYRVFVLYSDNE